MTFFLFRKKLTIFVKSSKYILFSLEKIKIDLFRNNNSKKEELLKMSKKRSDIEVLADILSVAKNGAKKSHIVYKANLNFEIVKGYLERLERSGLITGPNGKDRTFSTTEKGIRYLDHFEAFKDYMKL